jgi:hypothetical protein
MARLAMCAVEPSFEDRPACMEDRKKEGYF